MKLLSKVATALLCAEAAVSACAADDYPSNAVVLYASVAPHSPQLYIAKGDGSDARPLLADARYDYNASLSADSQWVVFTSEREGSPDIYRARIDGSEVERLTNDPAFDDAGTLSPDGKFLAFVSTRETGNANIWVLEMATGKLTNLTAGSPGDYRPAWSPDGEWLVFSSIRDSAPMSAEKDPAADPRRFYLDIYVMRRDGSGLRRLTHSGYMSSPRWSPDGRSVVAVQEDAAPERNRSAAFDPARAVPPAMIAASMVSRVVVIDVADGSITELAQVRGRGGVRSPQLLAPSLAAWTTPGQGILFSDGTSGQTGEFIYPSWSNDRRVMVFHRERTIPREPDTVEAQGSPTAFKPRTALDPNFRVMRVGVFPSQRPLKSGWIVMNDQDRGANYNAILAVSPDGTQQRVIFRHPQLRAAAPAVSPDGTRIAFLLGGTGFAVEGIVTRLAIVNADGSGLVVLDAAGDSAAFPSWSPDGTKLVYTAAMPREQRGLRIIDLATNTVTTLTTGPDSFPTWSPLGDRIVFTRSPHSILGAAQLYSVKPDGTDLERLTFTPGAQDAHAAFSLDGRWIAFTSTRINPRVQPLAAEGAPHDGGQIFVMRADGSDVRQLTDAHHNGSPAWMLLPAD